VSRWFLGGGHDGTSLSGEWVFLRLFRTVGQRIGQPFSQLHDELFAGDRCIINERVGPWSIQLCVVHTHRIVASRIRKLEFFSRSRRLQIHNLLL